MPRFTVLQEDKVHYNCTGNCSKIIIRLKCANLNFFTASFEVEINNELVYSKLQTLSFPNFDEVSSVVKDVSEGNPIRKVIGQQPFNCAVM